MTPLTAVLGHLETLSMDDVTIDDRDRRKQLAIALREAQRLRRVIGDLLDAARYEAGGVELNCEEMSMTELARQVIARHEHACRTKHVALDAEVAAEAETFEADPFRIEQALDNAIAQRAASHAAGWAHLGEGPARGCEHRDRGLRFRRRHSAGAPAAHLRPFLQGVLRRRHRVARERPGPVDCQGDREPARWPGECEQRAGRRDDHQDGASGDGRSQPKPGRSEPVALVRRSAQSLARAIAVALLVAAIPAPIAASELQAGVTRQHSMRTSRRSSTPNARAVIRQDGDAPFRSKRSSRFVVARH